MSGRSLGLHILLASNLGFFTAKQCLAEIQMEFIIFRKIGFNLVYVALIVICCTQPMAHLSSTDHKDVSCSLSNILLCGAGFKSSFHPGFASLGQNHVSKNE